MIAARQDLRHTTLHLLSSALVLLEHNRDKSTGSNGRVWWYRHKTAACSQNGENVIDSGSLWEDEDEETASSHEHRGCA